jgi:hypothetical protein
MKMLTHAFPGTVKTTFGILIAITMWHLPGVAGATILNPSFEGTSGWSLSQVGVFGLSSESSAVGGLPTDGSLYGRIYSGSGSIIDSGEYGQWSQSVDFSQIGSITFDATLVEFQRTSGTPAFMSFLKAVVRVDGNTLWTGDSLGTFLNQTIDTSAITGVVNLDFRLQAIADSNDENTANGYISDWFVFDNLRMKEVPEPSALALAILGLLPMLTLGRRSCGPRFDFPR